MIQHLYCPQEATNGKQKSSRSNRKEWEGMLHSSIWQAFWENIFNKSKTKWEIVNFELQHYVAWLVIPSFSCFPRGLLTPGYNVLFPHLLYSSDELQKTTNNSKNLSILHVYLYLCRLCCLSHRLIVQHHEIWIGIITILFFLDENMRKWKLHI